MLTAGAIMTTDIVTSRPNVSIEAAIDTLLSQEISGLPVTDDDGRLVGVITEFAVLAVAYDRRVKNHTVGQHMTRDIITVDRCVSIEIPTGYNTYCERLSRRPGAVIDCKCEPNRRPLIN